MTQTLFISDLHLDAHDQKTSQVFLQLLAGCDQAVVDAIYILGDLFEAWIGDDDQTPFHTQIIQALHATHARGIPLYFMGGNRDFLIGKRFARETGCQLLGDETRIDLYGTPVLLMHGDTLCTQDTAYLRARKIGRHAVIKQTFLWLPLFLRRNIAQKMREKSKKHTSQADAAIMDVSQDEVVRMMEKHQVRFLIHGHTHRLGMHEFELPSHVSATRLVLDAWHERGNALIWDSSGKREFVFL